MPKRRRAVEHDSDDSDDGAGIPSTQVATPSTQTGHPGDSHDDGDYDDYNRDAELQDGASKVIRLVLAREARGQLVRREHITGVLSSRRVPYDAVLKEAAAQLEEVYGMKMAETPVQGDAGRKKTKAKPKAQYVVVSNLLPESRRVLGEIWSSASEHEVANGKKFTDSGYFLPKFRHTPAPVTNQDLVKTGMAALVVALVILAENHVSETELFRSLAAFGISDKPESRNTNTHLTTAELMADMVKRDYLNREVTENVTAYSLGKRALVEFNPHSVLEFVRGIYGDRFDSITREQTVVTIERVYGAAALEELARNELPDPGAGPPTISDADSASAHAREA